jgi:hypothetical protein
MALIPIMGQPVNLVPNNERAYGCELENPFCTLYKKSADVEDVIMFEMRQTPCAPSIISNGNFADGTDWVADVDVVIAQNKATHVVGVSGELTQDLSAVLVDNYHQVKVTVTGMSAGNIQIYFTQAGMASATIYANGIYTFYLYDLGDNDNITFVFSADCDGSVSDVAVFGLLDDTEATAAATLNTLDGTYYSQMNGSVIEDYIIYRAPNSNIDEGCYQITVIDPCVDIEQLTEVFTDINFADNTEWTAVTDIGVLPTVSGSAFNDPADYWGKLSYAAQAFNIPTGVKLFAVARLQTGTLFTGGECWMKTDLVNIALFGSVSGTSLQQNTLYTQNLVFEADYFDISSLDMGIEHQAAWNGFFPTPTANGGYITGDNNEFLMVSLRVAPFSDVNGVFTSNCLKVSSDVGNTQIVEGFADLINDIPLGNKSLGFMFLEDTFWLRARLSVQFSNPHSPIKTENYLYSNGRKKKAYSQVGKAWDLTFHAVDENMHDTIANIINCDQFTINGNEYITDEKEYTANYGPKGVDPVGESTIEVQKIENTRFNTNI